MANYFQQNKHEHYMSQQSLSFSNSIFWPLSYVWSTHVKDKLDNRQ